MFSNFFPNIIYEIMWKNMVEPDKPQITIWRMCFACWVSKATGTLSEYVILNPLKPELNPICYLLALLGAHHFLHVSRIRVKLLTLR